MHTSKITTRFITAYHARKSICLHKISAISFLLLSFLTILACATTPVTGRSQLILITESQENALGIKSYNQLIGKVKLSDDKESIAMVNRVGQRIADATDRSDYDWEFNIIDDDKTANAFALPGGKVAVYSGLFRYTLNETGLAFVLAHEVGHALARHGGERFTRQLLVKLGRQGLNMAVGSQSSSAIQAINQGYGVATQIGVQLPFSRTQEYEADHIGLILMAKAGYDPREASGFFLRMMEGGTKKELPEFLSTHPADSLRIERLKELIPEALQYYEQ